MALVSRARHELARRRWLARTLFVALVAATWWVAVRWADQIDAERARWGTTVDVWVAERDVAAGELLAPAVSSRAYPIAMVPETAVRDVGSTTTARRAIPAGVVVTEIDVAASGAPGALLDDHHVGVAVVERVPSGARVGDRVMIVADQLVLAATAAVIGVADERVLVAVPIDAAPAVAAATHAPTGVSLLLLP